jgi:hypothetical protein
MNPGVLTQAQLARHFRSHVRDQLFDESGAEPHGFSIYTLSDPRDLRAVRYVGQTSAPARRFKQHLSTARLWLPDERPWWVKSPKLRPLYEWIRELYRDELRLPAMVVTTWVDTASAARVAERAEIFSCLERRLDLLNVEGRILGRQIVLI